MFQKYKMKTKKNINQKFNIFKGILPIGSEDWYVTDIKEEQKQDATRKVNSLYHQTSKLLVSSFYKPISQLSTLE